MIPRGERLRRAFLSSVLWWCGAHALPAPAAESAHSVLDLQATAQRQRVMVTAADGSSREVTLIDLNPTIHGWYVLSLQAAGEPARTFHLQNPRPFTHVIALDPQFPDGVEVRGGEEVQRCALWSTRVLDDARDLRQPYVPLCDGALYLRRQVTGGRTDLEATVEFLRDNVPGGEALVNQVKNTLFEDAEREAAEVSAGTVAPGVTMSGPRPADLAPEFVQHRIDTGTLGIVPTVEANALAVGQWYPAQHRDGVYVSLIEPGAVAADILASDRSSVNPLDGTERGALVYLIAFDLARYALAFAVGTSHPRVDWSPRPPAAMRDDSLPGPDGFGTVKPLVTTGAVPPWLVAHTAATFAGGFKRAHGAFRYGELASRNHGSHYGFVEEGVVLSRLQPGLATLLTRADGSVDMRTWSTEDDQALSSVRFARQNGVPLVEWDATAGRAVAGALVNRWGPGNWSGSADMKLRTVRAGACLQAQGGHQMLIYAYFSSATPSAMARVFQAYGCRYAMLLDMNALVHTYLALYPAAAGAASLEHLVRGMADADPRIDGRTVPRFLAGPDNRDFFYLLERTAEPP
jgi:hypothetical protein